MKKIMLIILIYIMPLMANLTVYDYIEDNNGGNVKFKIQNPSASTIDVSGYKIRLFGTGIIYPGELKQQPQPSTSGLVFNTSVDCGNDTYMFTGTAIDGTTIPSGQCWFGNTSYCDQNLEFWLGENGQIPMNYFDSSGVVITDALGNIISGEIPPGFEACAGLPVTCLEDITIYDTTIVPVEIDSFYTVAVPIESTYTVGVAVDSFYNVGVPVDSFYTIPIVVYDTIIDTTWITLTLEKEAEYELVVVGDVIQSASVHQQTVESSPILKVEVNIDNLNSNDNVILSYDVIVYDQIGQYVDKSSGIYDLPITNGHIIETYEYQVLRTNDDDEVIDEHNRLYGNGAYIIKIIVKLKINDDLMNKTPLQKTVGYMR